MDWIDQLKTRVGRYMLWRAHPARRNNSPIPSFDSVQDIGILYNADNKENEEQVNRVAHYLRDQGKKVWMMGYVNAKSLPHTKKFHISSEYFWREKLSWFNLPVPSKVGHFVTHRFDLLMNLYFEDTLPLQALSAWCPAAHSMGAPMREALQYNDTLIDTGDNHSIQNLASQMVHYLKVINQK